MNAKKPTQKDAILKRLEMAGRSLAVHEFNIIGVSDNSLASRLPEMALAGLVVGQRVEGKPYKVWRLVEKQRVLL